MSAPAANYSPRKPPVIAVVGPTGSGKTALAVEIAVRFGGEIINTDSLQVYRYLDIGTAKPSAAERLQAVHHLLDVVNPDQPFSAGDYVAQATEVLSQLARNGRLAILCGGTGLYFRALTEGLAQVPPIPQDIRLAVEERLRSHGAPACHTELGRLDPARAALLHPNDTARIGRALEVVLATGMSIDAYHAAAAPTDLLGPVLHVGWQWERSALYARINHRVEDMLEMGWVEEVRRVLAMGFPPDAKPLRSIGYREIVEHLTGKREGATLVPEIQRRTRNYAKRQMTWFRHQTRVDWFAPGELDAAMRRVDDFLRRAAAPGQRAP